MKILSEITLSSSGIAYSFASCVIITNSVTAIAIRLLAQLQLTLLTQLSLYAIVTPELIDQQQITN